MISLKLKNYKVNKEIKIYYEWMLIEIIKSRVRN